MKKALKINLSGQIFHIDEDAYDKLKVYLDTISSHFSNVNEGKEILSDIETRIGELFHEKMSDENQVISIKEVEEVIDIMGRPEEIADEEETPGGQKGRRQQRANRRLYRDPDNSVLGGVSSGLSAYFNLDVLLVRILFVIFTLMGGGLPVLLYIILWIAVPKAETAAEKLEMRGENITVSNIEKTVKEEYEGVKENLKKARNSKEFRRTEDFLTRFFKAIGSIILVFLRIIVGFVAFVFVLTVIALLFGTISLLFFGVHVIPFSSGGNFDHTWPELIQPFVNPDNASVLILSVLLLILIPVLSIIYGIFKAVFRFKARDKGLGLGALAIWILALVSTFMMLFYEGRNYKDEETVSDTKELAVFRSDTLYLSVEQAELNKYNYEDHIRVNRRWIFSDNMETFYGEININVRKSDSQEYTVRIEKTARGRNFDNAREMAEKIMYDFKQKDSSLVLNPYYAIEKQEKWRAQDVEITVYVPVGKAVKFNRNTEDFLGWIYNTEGFSHWEFAGKTLVMNEDGLRQP